MTTRFEKIWEDINDEFEDDINDMEFETEVDEGEEFADEEFAEEGEFEEEEFAEEGGDIATDLLSALEDGMSDKYLIGMDKAAEGAENTVIILSPKVVDPIIKSTKFKFNDDVVKELITQIIDFTGVAIDVEDIKFKTNDNHILLIIPTQIGV